MDRQLQTDWPRALNAIARSRNPLHRTIFKDLPMDYYWSAYQTEWATALRETHRRSAEERLINLHALDALGGRHVSPSIGPGLLRVRMVRQPPLTTLQVHFSTAVTDRLRVGANETASR
jgi:hypothetical protein